MADPTRVRIETAGRLVEVSEPGRTAEDLAGIAKALWPLTANGAKEPMGFAGTSTVLERRPSPAYDRTLSNGRHRPPPAPAVRSET